MDGRDILVDAKSVTVCGVRISKPRGVSASQWLDFWERVKTIGQ